jgi:hypothetical protein
MSCPIVANATRLTMFLIGWLAPIFAGAWAADAPNRQTAVGIEAEKFTINGQPTYAGRTWYGKQIEGLLLNSRRGRKHDASATTGASEWLGIAKEEVHYWLGRRFLQILGKLRQKSGLCESCLLF